MAEDDIYGSKGKYEAFKAGLKSLVLPLEKKDSRTKYYCKNRKNLAYFERLISRFEAKDMSFVRRMRLFKSFMIIIHNTEKVLSELERDDVDYIVACMHQSYKSPKSKSDFIKDIRYIWKIILPELDKHGRPDEMLVPYVVRHLSPKVDRSKEKSRNDKLDFDEFQKILDFFSNDARMQAYLMLSVESIARPQEILYRRIKDFESHDNYAIIHLSDHGKEGTGIMQCIDSYPFLINWIEKHPFKNNPESFIFINTGKKKLGSQLTPLNVNKKLNSACRILEISKNITCYSLKRNGVTFRRLRGESDMEIQHAARWTSTKQLKTYDMSSQNDALRIQLIKRGLVTADKAEHKQYQLKNKECSLCKSINEFNALHCNKCKRPLDRKLIEKEEQDRTTKIAEMQEKLQTLTEALEVRKPYEELMERLMKNPKMQEIIKQELKST